MTRRLSSIPAAPTTPYALTRPPTTVNTPICNCVAPQQETPWSLPRKASSPFKNSLMMPAPATTMMNSPINPFTPSASSAMQSTKPDSAPRMPTSPTYKLEKLSSAENETDKQACGPHPCPTPPTPHQTYTNYAQK